MVLNFFFFVTFHYFLSLGVYFVVDLVILKVFICILYRICYIDFLYKNLLSI